MKNDPAKGQAPSASVQQDAKRKAEEAWMKAPEDRQPLSKEEMEQLAKRERAIRMRKGQGCPYLERARERDRDNGPER